MNITAIRALIRNDLRLYRSDRRAVIVGQSVNADGGDGYSTFLKGTSRLGGAQDIDALTAFMAQFKAPAAPYRPGVNALDAASARIQRTGGTICPTGANVNP